MTPIRVLVADDEALVRHALRVFIGDDDRTTVVGEASDGHEAVAMCHEASPDVVVIDIQMPGMNGIEATATITAHFPRVRVLALTTFSSEAHVVAALRSGASGYLVKDTVPDELITAIVCIYEGGSVLSPQISRSLIDAVRDSTELSAAQSIPKLTDRELSIVQLLARGMSNVEIAEALHLSEATIKANFTRIILKWNVRDRVQVLIRAAQANLVSF